MNVAGAKTVYPQDVEPPPPAPGQQWMQVRLNRTPGRYDEFNQPHLNIHEAASKNEKYSGGRFVRDDKSEMLVIYGHEKNMPPLNPDDKGHFHAESAEAWLVFSGKIRYAFEGQQPFIASEGDVVYVPSNTWHATRFIGDNACRLSITEYVGNALLLPPLSESLRRNRLHDAVERRAVRALFALRHDREQVEQVAVRKHRRVNVDPLVAAQCRSANERRADGDAIRQPPLLLLPGQPHALIAAHEAVDQCLRGLVEVAR